MACDAFRWTVATGMFLEPFEGASIIVFTDRGALACRSGQGFCMVIEKERSAFPCWEIMDPLIPPIWHIRLDILLQDFRGTLCCTIDPPQGLH